MTLEGNTHYYLMLAGDETIYDFPVAEFPQIIRFREGDFISFTYSPGSDVSPADTLK